MNTHWHHCTISLAVIWIKSICLGERSPLRILHICIGPFYTSLPVQPIRTKHRSEKRSHCRVSRGRISPATLSHIAFYLVCRNFLVFGDRPSPSTNSICFPRPSPSDKLPCLGSTPTTHHTPHHFNAQRTARSRRNSKIVGLGPWLL